MQYVLSFIQKNKLKLSIGLSLPNTLGCGRGAQMYHLSNRAPLSFWLLKKIAKYSNYLQDFSRFFLLYTRLNKKHFFLLTTHRPLRFVILHLPQANWKPGFSVQWSRSNLTRKLSRQATVVPKVRLLYYTNWTEVHFLFINESSSESRSGLSGPSSGLWATRWQWRRRPTSDCKSTTQQNFVIRNCSGYDRIFAERYGSVRIFRRLTRATSFISYPEKTCFWLNVLHWFQIWNQFVAEARVSVQTGPSQNFLNNP